MISNSIKAALIASTAAIAITGCNKASSSYSLLNDSSQQRQQAVLIPKKIDILWVIDNSGSMESSQTALVENFQSFISRFQNYNYDFRMAVTATDAWRKQFNSSSEHARIRDGAGSTHSGVFVMDRDTPNLANVFSINIRQGLAGTGDERAFESFKQTLLEPWNVDFRRPEAFLAIIIVSDEEDFSHSGAAMNESYSNPNLYSVESYRDFLDTFTEINTYGKNYSVSSIYIPDQACLDDLAINAQKISTRLPALADLTGGVKASLCENFGESLELISDSIIQLSSVFKLDREPLEETISVVVDGTVVERDPHNGWTYNPAELTITFHGTAVPGADADIRINFHPKTIKL